MREFLDDNPIVGEPRINARRFWTGREEKILRLNYPLSGIAGCVPLLPGRSAASIYNHVGKLGLRSKRHNPGPRQRWDTNEHIDAVIQRGYAAATTKSAIKELARSLGRPRWWVSCRARRLGCVSPRFKELPWSEAEIEIVSGRAHQNPAVIRRALIRKGFNRSETAIVVKLNRIGVSKDDPNHFTATGLSKLMGMDAKSVTRWIDRGWLKASRRGTERTEAQGGDQWWIHRKDARCFIIENTAAFDIRKVDKFWFVDFLAGPA